MSSYASVASTIIAPILLQGYSHKLRKGKFLFEERSKNIEHGIGLKTDP